MKQFQQKLGQALKLVAGAIKAAELKLPCYNSWEEAFIHSKWREEGKVKHSSRHERFYV